MEHGIIPPKFGWELHGYDDLGDLSGNCEYCGTEIRYVFLIQHAKWRTLEVGTDCCDNLTCTQAASDLMESLRKHLERRKRFVSSPRWEQGHAGELTIKQKQLYVSLVPHEGAYKLRVNGKLGKRVFSTLLDAKASAFDLVESGAIGTWLQKQEQERRERVARRFDYPSLS